MIPLELTQAKLEILRALETFQGGATAKEIATESSVRMVGPLLLHMLRHDDYLNRERQESREFKWNLTPSGRGLLVEAEGLMVARCKFCEDSWLIPEVSPKEYSALKCKHCGRRLVGTRILRTSSQLSFPAPEGDPPTMINRRDEIVFTFDPYVDDKGILRCGAKTTSGIPCRIRGLESRRRRCRLHRGTSKGRTLVTGKYSKYLEDSLGERYEEFINDEDLLDLRDEIALLRAKVMEDPGESIGTISKALDTIGRLVSKVVEREEGLKLTISVGRVEVIVNLLAGIIMEELGGGCPHCGGDLNRIQSALSERLLPENLQVFEGKGN